MLAIRLRVRPCSARCSPRSLGRSTVKVPCGASPPSPPSAAPPCSIFIAGLTAWLSSPLGPFTVTRPGDTEMVTPAGTSIGFFPILLIASSPRGSPHVGDDLAADALLLCLVPAHHPARGRDDRGAHPAEDPRDLGVLDVAAPPRPRDALQAGDDRLAVVGVLEADPDQLADRGRLDREIDDVALLLEDAAHVLLEARCRDLDVLVLDRERVADPGQVVRYRVAHHGKAPANALPARLGHPGHVAVVRGIAQAQPAEAELAVVGARAAAPLAAVVRPGLVLRLAPLLYDL